MRQHTDFLTHMLARLSAQKACLDFAAEALADVPGHILEIGLGKARTYDRLRYLFPEREIYVFDVEVHCPAALKPPESHLILGDIHETLPLARERFGRQIALAHADIGSFDPERDQALFTFLANELDQMLMPGGIMMSDRVVPNPPWQRLPQPGGDKDWVYYMYRRA